MHYDEYRQFTPNPEGDARSNITPFDNRQRQQKNSECCELRAWKQSPLDSDHVLFLNTSLTWTDKGVYFKGLCNQLFAKWGIYARVSYLSHSAQIQIFNNISLFAM